MYAKKGSLKLNLLFTSLIIKKLDDKYLMIKNNKGRINSIGGKADNSDFCNNIFNSDLCIKREVMEEIGIDIDDKNQVFSYNMKYIKSPNNDNYYPI